MKAGFPLSIAAHLIVLAIVFISLSAPPLPENPQTEEVPITLAPLSETLALQKGEAAAPKKEKAAQKRTKKPEIKPEAKNAGDANIDTQMPEQPKLKEREVKAPPPALGEAEGKSAPEPEKQPAPPEPAPPKPAPAPERPQPAQPAPPKPAPPAPQKPQPALPEPAPPKPAPAPERPQPAQPAPPKPAPPAPQKPQPALPEPAPPKPAPAPQKPQPAPEQQNVEAPVDDIGDFLKTAEAEQKPAAEKPKAEEKPKTAEKPKAEEKPAPKKPALPEAPPLPVNAPVPLPRPEEPKKPEPAKGEKDGVKAAQNRNALIDRTRTSGGGLKRSQSEAAAGAQNDVGSQDNLQQTLNNIIGSCVARNWDIGVIQGSSAYDLRVQVHFRLNKDGSLDGEPDLTPAGGDAKDRDVIKVQAMAALKKCAPFQLPPEKYSQWHDVTVNMRAFPD